MSPGYASNVTRTVTGTTGPFGPTGAGEVGGAVVGATGAGVGDVVGLGVGHENGKVSFRVVKPHAVSCTHLNSELVRVYTPGNSSEPQSYPHDECPTRTSSDGDPVVLLMISGPPVDYTKSISKSLGES